MAVIKYIGYIDSHSHKKEERHYSPAAATKLLYIAKAIASSGFHVDIFSPSFTKKKTGYFPARTMYLSPNVSLKLYFTFGAKTKFFKLFRKYLPLFSLFWDLLVNTKKEDTVIVYHSLNYMKLILLAKRIKKFNFVLEVEEIYQDIVDVSPRIQRSEYKIIRLADKYIFSTDILKEKLNIGNKPYLTIYGTYQVEEDRECKFNDGKIHVVYAGTFDPRKGGAIAAVEAAVYLPEYYHVHIIGFGSNDDISNIQKKIEEISQKTQAIVTYDGLFSGEDYICFLQKCDIGLSTQIPEAAYNETSFPSKILSYMANGLRVVSIRIRAIEISDVGKVVYYYNEPDPEAIANSIVSIDLTEAYDSRELIRNLNKEFVTKIKYLLE